MLPLTMEQEEAYEEELTDKNDRYLYHYPCQKTLLSAKQEIDLCHKAQNGDESAREQMVTFNLRLVIRIATRYRGKSLALDDMVQEGVIGLITAIGKFDGARGYKFSTYATYWIRQAIVRALEKQDRKIRIPAHMCQLERKVRQAEYLLATRLGRDPTAEEVRAVVEVPPRVMRMIDYLQPEPLSLDLLMGADQDLTLGDLLETDEAINPEAVVVQRAIRREWEARISRLKERERVVVERRFGFYDGGTWTYAEVARVLGVSREAIRQIEKRALKKLMEMEATEKEVA